VNHSQGSVNTGTAAPNSTNYNEHLTSWRRILLLIMAVTVHNIPEGMLAE